MARSSNRGSAGFTLTEVLVALALVSVVVLGVARGVVSATRGWTDHRGRLETQQSLRSAVAALSREVRIAGACMLPYDVLPPINFRPLDGTDAGTTDTIIVRANPRCAEAAVVAPGCNPCATIPVATGSTTNFAAGMWAYIVNGAGTGGEYFRIQSVTSSTIVVNSPPALTGDYSVPLGSDSVPTVFGIEQRTFAIATIGGIPTLTLQTLTLPQTALVKGIESLDIHYVLNRTYSAGTCDAQTGGSPNLCVVNLPTAGDWHLVRVVTFAIGARSTAPVRASGSGDGFFHLNETFEIAPRNFVFPPDNPRL